MQGANFIFVSFLVLLVPFASGRNLYQLQNFMSTTSNSTTTNNTSDNATGRCTIMFSNGCQGTSARLGVSVLYESDLGSTTEGMQVLKEGDVANFTYAYDKATMLPKAYFRVSFVGFASQYSQRPSDLYLFQNLGGDSRSACAVADHERTGTVLTTKALKLLYRGKQYSRCEDIPERVAVLKDYYEYACSSGIQTFSVCPAPLV